MQTLNLEEAQVRLREIVTGLRPGEEIMLTDGEKPVATLRAAPVPSGRKRKLGTLKGTVLEIADDFDAIPEGFEDYLP